MDREIAIDEYEEAWPSTFQAIRETIMRTFADVVVSIEHVGSTAVPGLAAKPIIDIDVLLSESASLGDAVSRLEALGYRHLGDLGMYGREAFDQPAGLPDHHLYVCLPNASEFHRHIAFRDYLRSHPAAAQEYSAPNEILPTVFATIESGTRREKLTSSRQPY